MDRFKLTSEQIEKWKQEFRSSQLVAFLAILVQSNQDFVKEVIPCEAENPTEVTVTLLKKDITFVFDSTGDLTRISNYRPKIKIN